MNEGLNRTSQTEKVLSNDLRRIEFTLPVINIQEGKAENKSEPTREVTYNGVLLKLDVHKAIMYHEGFPSIKITIRVSSNEYVAGNVISIEWEDDEYVAEMNVTNKDRSLKGLGVQLCEISHPLIQKFANQMKLDVIDRVTRSPRGTLTSEKWEEIFKPYLEKYNYQHMDENVWERVVRPI